MERANGVQAAVYALVCGPTDQHLAPDWEAHNCLCQAHQLTVILYLARDMVHLQSKSEYLALLHALRSPEVQNRSPQHCNEAPLPQQVNSKLYKKASWEVLGSCMLTAPATHLGKGTHVHSGYSNADSLEYAESGTYGYN